LTTVARIQPAQTASAPFHAPAIMDTLHLWLGSAALTLMSVIITQAAELLIVDPTPRAQTSLAGVQHHPPSSAQNATLATIAGPPTLAVAILMSAVMEVTTVPLQTIFAQTQTGALVATLVQSQENVAMAALALCRALDTQAATATVWTNSGTLRSQLVIMFS